MTTDVLIIGGGVIGLCIARELAYDHSVTVVERGRCGMAASNAAAGMLGAQAEAYGDDAFFRLCVESREMFPGLASSLLDETQIDVGLDRTGTLLLNFTEADIAARSERFAWQKAAGFAIEQLPAEAVRREEPFISTDVLGGFYLPDDGQVDNRKLVEALRASCEMRSVKIIEGTAVDRLAVDSGKVTGAFARDTRFSAGTVVLAAGAWGTSVQAGFELPFLIKPMRGQILMFRTAKRLFKHVIVGPRGYIVPRADGRVLSGATMDDAGFDDSITNEATAHLIESTAEISPSLGSLKPQEAWTGFRPYAPDRLPVLGRVPNAEGLILALGHFRNGILLSPVTAKLAAAELRGTGSMPTGFSPSRFYPAAA
ncbi:MAG: glycine oxidase ThiO [Acidobacteria bacterium OLB17]|nr:MAG: glycine oxidase ThiO [Acidobacteria bacterium OLB17]MCZ2390859.1 glycine oxidase ThiO [Acidobacteriota bacterium]